MAGYRYSWLTLFRSPSGSLAGLVAAAILGAAVAARGRNADEPSIHDRYTDFIVGVPLLGSALVILLLLPTRLSVFFWFSRLDLLSLALFVAGAIALLFGIRAFWRLGSSIAALFLLWALRDTALISIPTVAALAISAGIAARMIVSHPERRLPTSFRSSVQRPSVAGGLLLILVIVATIQSGSLDRFHPLLGDNGLPRIVRTSSLPPIDGWSARRIGEYGWIKSYIGPDASWARFAYTRGKAPQLLVDDISSAKPGPITNASLADLYRIHGYALSADRELALGDGVVGHEVSYQDAAGSRWSAVFWDWPVESSAGIRYERMVVSSERISEASTSVLISFASSFIAGSAR